MSNVDLRLLELTAILDNASVGILFSRNKVIQRCNRRVAEIFGYSSPEDLIGKPGIITYPNPESYERIGREAGPLLATGKSFHADWMFVKADGSPVWCNVYAKAVNPTHTDAGTVWILEDITEVRRTREALGQTLREMEAIMQNAPVSILFTRDQKIVRHNPKFAEMLRFGNAPILGVPARVLYRSDEEYRDVGRVAAPLLSAGKPFQQELYMRCQDGTDIWVNLIGYVLNPSNTSEGTVWIAEDRTVHKQRTAELMIAKERAELGNRAKSTFLTNMSHELRTPLNAVLGYAQILKRDKGLAERQVSALNTIQQSGEHLLTLINDILDLSKIEAGKFELSRDILSLPAFVHMIADVIRVKAEQKGLVFVYEVSADLPAAVRGDEKRLRQVVLNLLGNAVKFTDRGQVSLRIQKLFGNGSHARLRFEVFDTGIGIDEEQLGFLFQPFEQAGTFDHRLSGTGLGLAISRQLVRLMGSDIFVESKVGEGSRFGFELSLPLATEVPQVSEEPMVIGYEGPPKKLLIVDDVVGNRAMLVDMLGPLGFAIAEATNGKEALEQARNIQPDLILMDRMMPVMDGLEATRRIRQIPSLERTPIFTISASTSQEDRDQSLAAGVSTFIAKPVHADQLLHEIARFLGLRWVHEHQVREESISEKRPGGESVAPPPDEMQVLYELALVGNMRDIRQWAAHLASLDPKYAPFADKVHYLADGFESLALMQLANEHLEK